MKNYYLLASFFFSLNSFGIDYVQLRSSPRLNYQSEKNKLEVIFDSKKKEVESIMINNQKINIEYSDVFKENDERFYTFDINGDGHKDYGFNSAIGMKNKYFYYLIYNPKNKKFTVSKVIPKLEKLKSGDFIGTEYNGIQKTVRTYEIKDYKLVQKSKITNKL